MIEMSCVVQEDLGKVPSKTIKRRMDREVLGADTNLRLRDTGGFNGGPNDELKIDRELPSRSNSRTDRATKSHSE